MEEKILQKNKNGMGMMFLFILLYAAGIGAIVLGLFCWMVMEMDLRPVS